MVTLLLTASTVSVIGTVRSEDKKTKVEKLAALERYVREGRLEVVVVRDLVEAVWDWDSPVLRGVGVIAHVASPFDLTLPTYDQVAGPAIGGTRTLLRAAA
ncbi:hypothetical protein IAR50_002384 [Cryptococcus sp. DSM 104548]